MKDRLKEYLTEVLRGFMGDPPDSDYQKGYRAAMREVWDVWFPNEPRVDRGKR